MILGNVEFGGAINASNSNVSLLEIEELCVANLKALFQKLPADEKHDGVLALEGLTFGELSLVETDDPKKEPSAQDFLDLLALTKFDEGTYVNVENWLRRSAKDDDADEVFREMRKAETARRQHWWKRLLYAPFGFLYGYGTRNRWACIIWLFTLAVTVLMFWDGSGLEEIEKADLAAPRSAVVTEPDWVDKTGVIFRIHLPMIAWFSDPEWKPSAKTFPMWPCLWLRYDAVAHSLLVWNFINVTLIIASVSGLLKRRGS